MSTVTSGKTHKELLQSLLDELAWTPADLAMHLAERRLVAGTATENNSRREAAHIEALFERLESEGTLPDSLVETLENEWEGCFGGIAVQHHEKNGQSDTGNLQQQRSEALRLAIERSDQKVMQIARQANPDDVQYLGQKMYAALGGKKLLNDTDCAAIERALDLRNGAISIRPATADEMKGRLRRKKSVAHPQVSRRKEQEEPKAKPKAVRRQSSSTPSDDGNVIVTLKLDANLVRKLIGGNRTFDVAIQKRKKGLVLLFAVQATFDEIFAMME